MQSASDLAAARYSGCTRRGFLGAAAAASLTFSLPRSLVAVTRRLERPVRIGLIADLHHDVMHDGFSRMEAFVHEMQVRRPDAIMQLGDFAYPNTKNRRVIDLFNQAHKTSLHVIGNHDTDAGHSKQQCLDVWEVPGRYYMTTVGGIQFLVLDGNDAGSPTYQGGYPSYVGKEQINWLKEQLTSLDGPIIVACHQPLAGAWAVDNAREIQAILSAASDKVLLALNGHSHIDDAVRVDGVTYLHINSASYQWVGGDFQHEASARTVPLDQVRLPIPRLAFCHADGRS